MVLGFIEFLKNTRDNYLINGVKKIDLPGFKEEEQVRKRLIFSGRVQRVGFRLETIEMSKRLDLKGWVKNKENGNVEAQVQGTRERIEFLIDYLKSIKRINIENIEMEDLSLKDDKEFEGL